MLKIFRITSWIEGFSLLALVGFAMPAKYFFNDTTYMPIIGMSHGILWLCYLIVHFITSNQQQWKVLFWLYGLFLSIVPFGFLIMEYHLKKTATEQ